MSMDKARSADDKKCIRPAHFTEVARHVDIVTAKLRRVEEEEEMMKYSDVLAEWLAELGYTHCFFVAGGNTMHLLESCSHKMKCIPVVHEVAAGIAVEYFNEAAGGRGGLCDGDGGAGVDQHCDGDGRGVSGEPRAAGDRRTGEGRRTWRGARCGSAAFRRWTGSPLHDRSRRRRS